MGSVDNNNAVSRCARRDGVSVTVTSLSTLTTVRWHQSYKRSSTTSLIASDNRTGVVCCCLAAVLVPLPSPSSHTTSLWYDCHTARNGVLVFDVRTGVHVSVMMARYDDLVAANEKLVKRNQDAEFVIAELSSERERLLARLHATEQLVVDANVRIHVRVTL